MVLSNAKMVGKLLCLIRIRKNFFLYRGTVLTAEFCIMRLLTKFGNRAGAQCSYLLILPHMKIGLNVTQKQKNNNLKIRP